MINLHDLALHDKLDLLLLPHLGYVRYIEFLKRKFPKIVIKEEPEDQIPQELVEVTLPGYFAYVFNKFESPDWRRIEAFLLLVDRYSEWEKIEQEHDRE